MIRVCFSIWPLAIRGRFEVCSVDSFPQFVLVGRDSLHRSGDLFPTLSDKVRTSVVLRSKSDPADAFLVSCVRRSAARGDVLRR